MKKNMLIFIWFITIITFTSCTVPDDNSSSIDTNEINNTHCQLIGLESDLNDFKFISSINNKECFYQGFCFGGGNIYFSNPHDGQKLYCYNGFEAKKITDMPVYGLNFLNDSLYFLSNDNIIEIEGIYCPEGYLYRYDLKNDTVNKISNTMMGNIIAREDDILFIEDDENNIVSVYSFNLETNEIIKLHSGISTQNIDDYYVISEPLGDTINFYITNGNKQYLLVSGDIARHDAFSNNKYYYISQTTHSLYSQDLFTGECFEIDLEILNGLNIYDYTILEEDLYLLLSDGYIYKYNMNSEKIIKCESEFQYRWLYSDNSNLYSIVLDFNTSSNIMEYAFAKLSFDENNKIETTIINE